MLRRDLGEGYFVSLLRRRMGDDSVTEVVTTVREGYFVFVRQERPRDLCGDDCRIWQRLDRLLLDAAVSMDLSERLVSRLPGQKEALIQRGDDFAAIWKRMTERPLEFIDNTQVTEQSRERIEQLLQAMNGRHRLSDLVRAFDVWPSYLTILAIDLLIRNDLVTVLPPDQINS